MKRRRFIGISLAASSAGLLALADDSSPARKELLVNSGEDRDGKPFDFIGATFEVKVSGKDTEGRCVIFETTRHKKIGPPLHIHTDCDEWFFVQGGEFKFQAGDKIMRLKAGDSLLVPQEVPHSFIKVSEGDAQLIVMHQPAGKMEEYFRIVSQGPRQPPEVAREFVKQYGMRIVGPALTPD